MNKKYGASPANLPQLFRPDPGQYGNLPRLWPIHGQAQRPRLPGQAAPRTASPTVGGAHACHHRLGATGEAETADALVECALRHPADVVEGLEIIRSLTRIREPGIRRRQALLRLIAQHAAHAVRAAAEKASTLTTDESMMNAGTEDERR